jgi:hypothetical protein
MPSQNSRFETAEGDIWQHTVNNNDYDESELLYRRLRINDIPDEQFARFLEACVNPLATRDPKRIEKVVALFNGYLKNDGFIIQAAGQISGRTIYKVASAAGPGSLGKAYEVALSFAGEDRKYVEKVAAFVRGRN